MLYSKLGSIPKPETDGTDGWIEVEEPPIAGDGEEVVWWYPPGWVVRPIKPAGDWNWSQSEGKWTESAVIDAPVVDETITASDAVDSTNGSATFSVGV